jgi:hypothetical protein
MPLTVMPPDVGAGVGLAEELGAGAGVPAAGADEGVEVGAAVVVFAGVEPVPEVGVDADEPAAGAAAGAAVVRTSDAESRR